MMRRGLLLDRDGVVNADRGYVGKPEQFEFLPGLFPFLRQAQDKGFRIAILTNQSGVARGYYTRQDFEALTGWMRKQLAKEGIAIDLVLACFEHREGALPEYRRESYWRKPNPGMVLEAVQQLRLDPRRTVFIGDKIADMQAAQAGGIKTCLLFNANEKAPAGAQAIRSFDEALKFMA